MKTNIEMAREAGDDWDHTLKEDRKFLERFAELVRADERERIIATNAHIKALEAAVLAEREQIAQMFDGAPPLVEFAQNEHGGCLMCGFTPRLAVAAIRARGNT